MVMNPNGRKDRKSPKKIKYKSMWALGRLVRLRRRHQIHQKIHMYIYICILYLFMYVSNSHLQNKCALRSCLDVDTILWSLILFESTIFYQPMQIHKKKMSKISTNSWIQIHQKLNGTLPTDP